MPETDQAVLDRDCGWEKGMSILDGIWPSVRLGLGSASAGCSEADYPLSRPFPMYLLPLPAWPDHEFIDDAG